MSIYVFEEKFTYIIFFGFEDKPFLLPCFVCDNFFIFELCRQYKVWFSLFDKKRKCQFVPMCFNIVGISVTSSSNLVEMARYLDSFHVKEVEAHNGFDPEGMFMAHTILIGYCYVLIKVDEITKGADDNEATQVDARVVSMTSKMVHKKKKQVTHDDTNTRASSNTHEERVPLQEEANYF
jgi:hypothetical protein